MRSQEHLIREGRETASGDNVVVTIGPGITGTAQVGEELTRVAPVVSGIPGSTIAYQWFRGSDAIGGATGNTYTLVEADEGEFITLRAVVSNANASAVTRISRAVGPVAAAAP